MSTLWKRLSLGGISLLIAAALSATPAGAYCNTDPCATNQHLACSFCSYVAPVGGAWCRITVIYCVDCHTGEILDWNENVDYCTYGTV